VHEIRGALRLHASNLMARRLGLHPPMALADARAIFPGVLASWAEVEKDAQALEELSQWCTRFTPWASVDGADGIWLDISGCAHLFGGEDALCRDILRRFKAFQITARIGLSDTPGAAWALARYGKKSISIAPAEQMKEALSPLPPAALRLKDDITLLLKRFGLKTCGDLIALPRPALARRFSHKELGEAVLRRLDQALGLEEEPITPLHPPPHYRSRLNLFEPISTREAIETALGNLGASLMGLLNEDQLGTRHLSLDCFRVDGTVCRISISLSSASRSWAHMERLFGEKIDNIDPGFGIEMLCLSADVTEKLELAQNHLDADINREATRRLSELIDRYKNRFGRHSVRQPTPHHSHMPERAGQLQDYSAEQRPPTARQYRPRPLLLFTRPERVNAIAEVPDGPPVQFHWRRHRHDVSHAKGPERIALEWWRAPKALEHHARDYYQVEDAEGRRFWLYRDGLYEQLPSTPQWYIQGLFP